MRILFQTIPLLLLCATFAQGASGISQYHAATPIQSSFAAMQYEAARYYVDDEFAPINEKREPIANIEAPTSGSKKKSLFRAMAFSAVLPGAGEWYAGSRNKAKIFFGAEAAIWVGYFSYVVYKNWKYDDMIRQGDKYAHAQLEGRDDDFLDLVGFYTSIDDYNTAGRATDLDRPYLHDTPENHWRWETEEAQKSFRNLKNSYREANRRSQFMLGLAVVNRIVSIIDAIRDVHRYNSRLSTEFSSNTSYKLEFSIDPASDTQLKLTLLTPF